MATSSTDSGLFPVAQAIVENDFTSDSDGSDMPAGLPSLSARLPIPVPPYHFCALSLPQGCYQLSISATTSSSPVLFRSYKLGSLRVEKSGSSYLISGDTYRYSFFDILHGGIPSFGPTEIPIYPRSRYGSYLKATGVTVPKISVGPCRITLNLDEYDYTQPPAGSFDGSFPSAPSRSMTIYLTPASPPSGFTSAYFTGQVYIGGVLQPTMSLTLGWVSSFYRKATVEVHTLTGAVAPAPVPASGGGTEYFDTVYQSANWQMTTITDPTHVPVPAGVNPTTCWSSANLHNLMTSLVDFPTVNLDRVWYMHLLIVPAAMGCGRGVMFDTINVPREGVASFCNDGYPTSDSTHFGTAANQQQRNVPRAFLRSASHEITHGFNQIHQENEGGADNSIMTTTPSVADFLASHGGTFPSGINLAFNEHVRHHLIHLPDIVIRPGGMTFTAGHNGIPIPQADTEGDEMFIDHPALELKMTAKKQRVKLGEPLHLDWELKNNSDGALWLPGDLSVENDFAEITVTKPNGEEQHMPPYVIKCDSAYFSEAKSGDTFSATHQLFWSTEGFAFSTPGKHTVNLELSWRSAGATVGKKASVDVYVDYPTTEKENDVIAHLLNDEVGKYVALGGHAYHMKKAVEHVEAALEHHKDHPASKALASLYDAKKAAKQKTKD